MFHSFHSLEYRTRTHTNKRDQNRHEDPHKCKMDPKKPRFTLKPLGVPATQPPSAAHLWHRRREEGRRPSNPNMMWLHRCRELCEPLKSVVGDDIFAAGAHRSGPRPKPTIEFQNRITASTSSRSGSRSAGHETYHPVQISPSSGPLPATPARTSS
jgi:hypothetical protein